MPAAATRPDQDRDEPALLSSDHTGCKVAYMDSGRCSHVLSSAKSRAGRATGVNEMSSPRFKLEVLPAGTVVGAFQMLDAVHAGALDGGHGVCAYWYGKHKRNITAVRLGRQSGARLDPLRISAAARHLRPVRDRDDATPGSTRSSPRVCLATRLPIRFPVSSGSW